MKQIANGSGAGSLATYQTVVALVPPSTVPKQFSLEIIVTGLHVDHSILVRETLAGNHYANRPKGNNTDCEVLIVDRYLVVGQGSVTVSMIDGNGVSTNAAWTWRVFDTTSDDAENVWTYTTRRLTSSIQEIAGTQAITIRFEDEDGFPIPLVTYTILGVGWARANAMGVSQVGLDPGNYVIRSSPYYGAMFPDVPITVDEDHTTFLVTGSTMPITPPADATKAKGWLIARDANAEPEVGIIYQFRIKIEVEEPGVSYSREIKEGVTATNGMLQSKVAGVYEDGFDFRANTKYEGRRQLIDANTQKKSWGPWYEIQVPGPGTFPIRSITGGLQL